MDNGSSNGGRRYTDNKFLISLCIGLTIQAAGVVWWASNMEGEIRHNDFQIQMLTRDVEENSEFVKLWPAGKWGSGGLPEDVEQTIKIERLEQEMLRLNDAIYSGGVD